MTSLTLSSVEIRQLDGLFSLNDLHKASGGLAKHKPGNWLMLDQTKELISELEHDAGIPASKTVRGRGKAQGTYVVRELVLA